MFICLIYSDSRPKRELLCDSVCLSGSEWKCALVAKVPTPPCPAGRALAWWAPCQDGTASPRLLRGREAKHDRMLPKKCSRERRWFSSDYAALPPRSHWAGARTTLPRSLPRSRFSTLGWCGLCSDGGTQQ